MNIPKTPAEFKRLPVGAELTLLRYARGECKLSRRVMGVKQGEMRLLTEKGETSFLPLTDEFFHTEKTFGFKSRVNGKVMVEYKFKEEDA